MLRNAPFESWAVLCALASFVIAVAVFTTVLIRVFRMPRRESNRLASLPLDPDQPQHHESRK